MNDTILKSDVIKMIDDLIDLALEAEAASGEEPSAVEGLADLRRQIERQP